MALVPIRYSCQDGDTCPTLRIDTLSGDVVVQGYLVDAATAAEMKVPAGEGLLRVIDLADHSHLPAELDVAAGDWWLMDGRDVVAMYYHSDGRFRGAEVLDPTHVGRYRVAMEAAWRVAEDFGSWWVAHPQHRRSGHCAA